MEASHGDQGLYPLHRCKTIHLVRHAEGVHNVAGEKNPEALTSEEYFDAQLTPLGWQQVDNLRKHVQESGLSKQIDLVVISPLLRTMQTAVGAFGGEGYKDGIDVPPLMVAKAGNSNHPAISSLHSPPFLAVELCRELLVGHLPSGRRRSITEYQALFPAMNFSLIEKDDDILWKPGFRETEEELSARGVKFMNWLWTRNEKEIAIVSHSVLLYYIVNSFGNDCHPDLKKEMSAPFNNCELRSFIIVDKCMMGSDPATTNYPGKIPSGLDCPSDVADEKENA